MSPPTVPKLSPLDVNAGFTQEDLANQADLDVKTVRKAEKNGRIDLESLTRVALALGTSLGQFILPETTPDESLPIRETIIRWHLAWEAHNMEDLLAVYTDDAVLALPGAPHVPFGGVHRGKAEIRKAHEFVWAGPKQEPFRVGDFEILLSGDSADRERQPGVYSPSGELIRFPCLQIFSLARGVDRPA